VLEIQIKLGNSSIQKEETLLNIKMCLESWRIQLWWRRYILKKIHLLLILDKLREHTKDV